MPGIQHLWRSLLVGTAVFVSSAECAAQSTFVVDNRGGSVGSVPQIDQALAVANTGDRIEVISTSIPYDGFTMDRIGVEIVGIPGQGAQPIVRPSRVLGTDDRAMARVTNLEFRDDRGLIAETGLTLSDCDGPVVLRDLVIVGEGDPRSGNPTALGCEIDNCNRVVMSATTVRTGGREAALCVLDSDVFLRDCRVLGGLVDRGSAGDQTAIEVQIDRRTFAQLVVSASTILGGPILESGRESYGITGRGRVVLMNASVVGGGDTSNLGGPLRFSAALSGVDAEVTPECVVLGPTGPLRAIGRLPTVVTPDRVYLGTTLSTTTAAPPGTTGALFLASEPSNVRGRSLTLPFALPFMLGPTYLIAGTQSTAGAPLVIDVDIPTIPELANKDLFFQTLVFGPATFELSDLDSTRLESIW